MHVVFVEFAGAGIALWASGVDDELPAGTYTRGADLVRRLVTVAGPKPVERLVDRIVRDLWQEWQQSKRSRAVLSQHLSALPSIIETYRLPPGQIMAGLIEARKSKRAGGSIDLVAHRLASDIILKARGAGAIEKARLDESLCFFLLARLIGTLFAQSDALTELRPALDVCFGRKPRTPQPATPAAAIADANANTPVTLEPTDKPSPPAEVARVADSWMIPAVALHAAATADPDCNGSAAANPQALERKAALFTELQSLIGAAFETFSSHPAAASIAEARAHLDDGEWTSCDVAAAQAETAVAGADDVSVAVTMRVIRAKIAELIGDFNAAARHFAAAAAKAPKDDRPQRCRLLLMQASALVSEGLRAEGEKQLVAAAQVYAEAGGMLSEDVTPLDWANANVELGELLLLLGGRERRPERFLAAALHFKPAVDVFSRHQAMADWARAQYGLARALKGTGEFQGDVVTLGDAAFSFRAALGFMTKDRAPQEWADAQLGLGETLVRIAEETGDSEPLREAVLSLKSALAYAGNVPSTLDITTGKGALGRAYVVLAAHEQDETLLQEAITLLESVLSASSRALDAAEAAGFEQVRGTALWALGERRASVRLLEDAARAKLNALDHFTTVQDVIAVSRLQEDLEDLAEAIDHLQEPSPRAELSRDTARAS